MTVKCLAKHLCPPVVWELARRTYWHLNSTGSLEEYSKRRVISTLEELDHEIANAARAYDVSYEAHIQQLRSFEFAAPKNLPGDPNSAEYREAQMDFYRYISGRSIYDSEQCELTPLDQHRSDFPFPYFTHSCSAVGGQLIAIGYLLQAMDVPRGGRVLELGPGYGKTTIELVQTGLDVTAVDISEPFLRLIEHRCRALGRDVTTVCADMLEYRPEKCFDRVVFNACFHHCSDHARMVGRLNELVAEDGVVIFHNEPIFNDSLSPWGLCCGGQALWAIRRHGWLELVFRTDYFLDLLARNGWQCDVQTWPGMVSSTFVARRTNARKAA